MAGTLTGSRWQAWQRPPDALALRRHAPPTYKQDVQIRAVRPESVVLVKDGVRALFEVQGMPLQSSDPDAAEAFLGSLAGLLNALRPRGIQMVARGKPGGFSLHLRERERTTLALDDPAARLLGAAQVQHYTRMAANGDARAISFYVCLPARTPRQLADDCTAVTTLFAQIGLPLRRVVEPELSLVLAEWWRGDLPTHWYYRLGDVALNVAPHTAKVTA